MAAIVLGPAMGGLVGAALYYTLSQTITERTNLLRSELATLSAHLRHSATSPSTAYLPPPPPPTHAPRADLSELIKVKWNASLVGLVHGLESVDGESVLRRAGAVGGAAWEGAQGVLGRLGGQVGSKVEGAERVVQSAAAGMGAGEDATPTLQPRRAHDDTITPRTDTGGLLGGEVHTGIGMSPGGSEAGVTTNVGSQRLV